ncbi:DUF1570 domain-containing protein [Roseibacillus persicicus]|uniref:DUF1570 domain-containing protein n=1 Tax=Roseibacillus persicicus TaxID=454148 RepID=UPI00398B9B95
MPAILAFFFLTALTLTAQEKWPIRLQAPQPALKQLPDKEGVQAWETAHYLMSWEGEVSRPHLNDLARVAESVPLLFRQLPLPLWAPPKGGKAEIRICKDETSFVARGGPIGAAGFYHGRQATVLIRGDLLLNPPQARATRLRIGPDGDLLVHELCHLAMHRYHNLPPWLSEGLAEYFSCSHLGKGAFNFSESTRRIPQHIRKFYPVERFPILELPSLQALTSLTSREWIRSNNTMDANERYRPYATALLLIHYHLEGGPERRNELSNYLTEKLTNPRIQTNPPPIIANDLEERLAKFWKPKGLSIRFRKE